MEYIFVVLRPGQFFLKFFNVIQVSRLKVAYTTGVGLQNKRCHMCLSSITWKISEARLSQMIHMTHVMFWSLPEVSYDIEGFKSFHLFLKTRRLY